MSNTNSIQPQSTALKNAIIWMSETVQEYPEKSRDAIIKDVAIRFDLNPNECEFLHSKFKQDT